MDYFQKLRQFLKPVQQAVTQAPQQAAQFGQRLLSSNAEIRPGSLTYGALQPLAKAQQFIENPPQFNFTQNVQNPIARFGAGVAQEFLNQPGRSLQAAGRIGTDIRQGTMTPQRFIGNTAEAAILPLTFVGGAGVGKSVLKQTLAPTFKQALTRGALSGAKFGAGFGALQGLADNREAPSITAQLFQSLPNTLLGAGGGAVLGGGGAALANVPKATIKAVVKALRPNATPKQVNVMADGYLRNKKGQFMKDKPQWAGDLPQRSLKKLSKGEWPTKSIPKINQEIEDYLQGGFARIPGKGVEGGVKTQPQSKQAVPALEGIPGRVATGAKPPVPSDSLEDIVSRSGTEVSKKVNILDYLRTPERVLNKIGLGNESKLIRQKYDDYLQELPQQIDKITDWSKRVPPESNQRIFKWLDGQPITLDANEQKVANEIKNYLGDWADRLKLPKDKRITNYITHIFEKDLVGKEFSDEMAKIIRDRVPGSVYDPFTEQRLGKLGYVEDTWRALDAYVKRATRKVHMDVALEQTKKAAEKLEQSQYDYVKRYVDRINMRPTDWDNLLDNTIKSVAGYRFGGRPTAAISRTARQMVYRGTLGLNPASAIKNLTQGANTYARLGEKYTLVGYAKALKRLATGDDELTRVGVLRDNFIQDRTITAGKKFWETVDKGLFVFFETAEKINRGAAYFGAKAQALAKGMDEAQAIEYGKKVVRDTQFTFGSVDTPPVLSSDLGKTLLQFQSFNIKQGEFLGEMLKSKDIAGMLRWTLASLAIVFTVGKAIGMKPEDLIPTIRVANSPVFGFGEAVAGAVTGAPDKWGNKPETLQDRINPVLKSAVPLIPAGVQAKKTITGLKDVSKGYSETPKGLVKYPIKQDTANYLRGGILGPNRLPEAEEYRSKERTPLGKKQSELYKIATDQKKIYGDILSSREQNKAVDQAKEEIKQASEGSKTVGNRYIYWDESAGEVKSISLTERNRRIKEAEYSLAIDRFKREDDYQGWVKATEEHVKFLEDYKVKLGPSEEVEKLKLQNKIEDLKASISKYKGYGGFTKPKKQAIKTLKLTGIKTSRRKTVKVKRPSIKAPPLPELRPRKLNFSLK